MTLQLVVSCWRYWRSLTFHLSALAHPVFECKVIATVAYCPEDDQTVRVLSFFDRYVRPPGIVFDFVPFARPRLMRRAIARNLAALTTSADWVIFTDVDYIYPGHVLDEMSKALLGARNALLFTPCIEQSTTHSHGELELARISCPGLYDLTPELYSPIPLTRPIGGSQIVRGETARRLGYVPAMSKYHRSSDRWRRTFEDTAFRRACLADGLEIIALPTLGIRRIRHAQRGRETDCEN